MFTYYFCNTDIWKYTFFTKSKKIGKNAGTHPFNCNDPNYVYI